MFQLLGDGISGVFSCQRGYVILGLDNSTSLYTFFFLSSPVSCNGFLAGQRKFLSFNEYIFWYAQFTKGVWDHPFVDLFSLIRVEQKKIWNLSKKAPVIGLLSDGTPIIGFYQGGLFFILIMLVNRAVSSHRSTGLFRLVWPSRFGLGRFRLDHDRFGLDWV